MPETNISQRLTETESWTQMDRHATIFEIIDAQFALVKAGGANNMQVYGDLSYVVQYEPKPN